jgi:hypothetical protein
MLMLMNSRFELDVVVFYTLKLHLLLTMVTANISNCLSFGMEGPDDHDPLTGSMSTTSYLEDETGLE